VNPAVYLDSSAIAKVVVQEPGWQALEAYLRQHSARATSRMAGVEVGRALARVESLDAGRVAERIRLAFARLTIIEFDAVIASAAAELRPANLRSLDAIHLSTARELGDDLVAVVTYDVRMLAAARALGIATASP
jgi:predicted nucleic acid-binding protein